MTNSEIFKLAHKLTKENKKPSDNYSVIFGYYVKMIKAGKIEIVKENEGYDDLFSCLFVITSLVLITLSVFGIDSLVNHNESLLNLVMISTIPCTTIAAFITKLVCEAFYK